MVDPLTLLMCSPISDGAAAAVLVSERAAARLGVGADRPRIRASVVLSGNVHDKADPTAGSTGRAARAAFEQAGIGPESSRLRGVP